VTLISDVPLIGEALHTLASDLKRQCGTGGSVKDGVIEIQGDQRDAVAVILKKLGYTVKMVGG
jgi:translation initiation factor 1